MKDEAVGSEDIDEHIQDDELEQQSKNNNEKISSLEINAKSSKKATHRNRDTSLQTHFGRQTSPLIQEKKKKSSNKKNKNADGTTFTRPKTYSIFYSNSATM